MNRRWSNRHTGEKASRPRGPRRDRLEGPGSARIGIAEWLDGRAHTREWTPDHVAAYDAILAGLGGWPDKLLPRDGWVFDFRPEIRSGDHVVVPDFAGWRASRRVHPASEVPCSHYSERRYTDRPDWICDIVEPTNVGLVRKIKQPIYLRLGVANLWLVDRIASALEVYSAGDVGWHLDGSFQGNGILRAAPLKHVPFDLRGLWDSI